MNPAPRLRVLPAAIAMLAVLAGCAGLTPPETDEVSVYVLDARPVISPQLPRHNVVLAVGVPRARPGFDTPRMAYVKQPYEIEYFTKSRWADAPARMLGPLVAHALEQGGGFRAVVHNPGVVAGDVRLDIEIERLQHEFIGEPSRARVMLRAQLIDIGERRVIAARELEETEPAAADNAYAGVTAMNRALERLLARLAEFCASAFASR